MRLICVFPLVLSIYGAMFAQTVRVGQGSYTDRLVCDPSVPKDKQHIFGPAEDGTFYWAHGGGEWKGTIPAVPKITSNLKGKPIPTNDWWSSLVWKVRSAGADAPYSMPLYAYPLSFKAAPDGMKISSPHTARVKDAKFVHTGFTSQITVGLVGLKAPETKLHDFTDLTVTADWNDGALRAMFGRGLPFTWFERSGHADALVQLDGPEAKVLSNEEGVALTKVDGRYYGLFAPSESRWVVSGNVLTNSLAGKSYFTIGLLPSASDEQALKDLAFFRARAFAEPIAAKATYRYDEQTSTLITDFALTTRLREKAHGELNHSVMALLPHHYLNSSTKLMDSTYDSVRGAMKLVDGNSFQVKYTYHGVLPTLPLMATADSGYSKAQLEAMLKRTEQWQASKVETIGDTVLNPGSYWFGKHLGQMAQAALIADQMGDKKLRDHQLAQMKSLLEDWFTVTPQERMSIQKANPVGKLLYYDKTWGSLIAYPTEFGADCSLNDHHFHYGYWVMAAAVIARFDPAWTAQKNYGGMIDLLIRDVASPNRDDAMFPYLRSFDPYGGHCWASGHGSDPKGNNQESTSEAISFHASLIQWGEATGNKALRDLGIYMYTTEIETTNEYWFDAHRLVFDRIGYTSPVTGILWGDGQEYRLWWTEITEGILSIQVLPVTGASLYLGQDTKLVLSQYERALSKANQDDLMRDVIWCYLALADPARAIRLFNLSGGNYVEENGGEFQAHTYHWLHNLAALGTVDWTTTADTATYAVFNKKGVKVHVAYNSSTKSRTVHFSDGVTLEVPPNQMVVR